MTSGYADVNGIKMYYEIYGEGKPLVLVHGAGSTIQTTYGRIIPQLQKFRKVIGVELQAHGRTTDRDAPISFEQDADDVAALLKQLGISKADVMGFSNGGNSVLQLAIRHPELCDHVVAASALLKHEGAMPQFWESMEHAQFEGMPKELKEGFMKVTPDSTRLINMFNKCVYRMVHFQEMSDETIRSIKHPVLLVNGDRDVATSEHMVAVSRLIPNCKLAIFPGGHGEYMGESASPTPKSGEYAVMPVLRDFLE